jgi:hypothetical protein
MSDCWNNYFKFCVFSVNYSFILSYYLRLNVIVLSGYFIYGGFIHLVLFLMKFLQLISTGSQQCLLTKWRGDLITLCIYN